MTVKGLLFDVKSNIGRVKIVDLEEDDLHSFYEALDCDLIDIVSRKIGGREFSIVCDDEALLKDGAIISAIDYDGRFALAGNLFVCNSYKEHLASLSKEDIDFITENIVIASISKPSDKNFHTYPVLVNVGYV